MEHSPIVQELVDYFNDNKNDEFKKAFSKSFERAKNLDVEDFDTLKIASIEDYFKYMDEYLNWVPFENGDPELKKDGNNVYMHICMFYFILDTTPVNVYQSPIDPDTKYPYLWLSDWIIRYACTMGKWMDETQSWDVKKLQTFRDSPNYRIQDYIEEDWSTFNEFFARRIRPELRPLAAPGIPEVIVSPADCKYDGCWEVNKPEATVTTFDVKGVPWHISQLLHHEELKTDWGPLFAGGVFTHSFLAPDNYHRQHAPVSGVIREAIVICGLCYLEVEAKTGPDGRRRLGMHRHMRPRHQRSVDAPNTPGYQFLQARALILIESEIGLVAVLPIGMAQVSSVVLSPGIKCGAWVNKGDELSKFQLGGSDIVMVFQAKAEVQLPSESMINQQYNVRAAFGNATAWHRIGDPL